jgi:hypothetical protein
MAKFYGKVGFGEQTQSSPGVWDDVITERNYFGDILRAARQSRQGDGLNPDQTVGNQISIVADDYALSHIFAIRYVEWAGKLWTVDNTDVQRPRLLFTLGGVYNGPIPD